LLIALRGMIKKTQKTPAADKQRMVELIKNSRAQVHRLLDPDNSSATIESLHRA
jgi:hypothetical protein